MNEQNHNAFVAHINFNNEIQTCKEHSIKTAEYAGSRLRSIGLLSSAYLAGLLHDAGKYSEEFSDYISKAASGERVTKGSVIHSFAGCSYILNQFHDTTLDYKDITAEIIAYAIAAHHGLFDQIMEDGESGFEHRLHKQPEYDQKAMQCFFKECVSQEEIETLFEKTVIEITKKMQSICEISDDRQDELFFYTGLLARLILSSVIDGDRTDTYSFMSGQNVSRNVQPCWDKCVEAIESFLTQKEQKNTIDKARGELSNLCKNFASNPTDIYRLSIPTGSGKTLSSLRYALYHAKKFNKDRIFYIAPLISILEQNVNVIRGAVGDGNIVLEHHSNIVRDDDEYDGVTLGNELLLETWDAPIVVTTLVQFLNTLFGGKTSQIRRFAALTNSVVILDEVQSVPWRMLTLFNLAINFLKNVCNTTVLLCSATQPSFQEIDHGMLISSRSVIPSEEESRFFSIFKRSEICFGGKYRLDEIPLFLESVLENSNSLLVICNKKTESEYLYHALKGQEASLFHLSAAMCMAHREKTLLDLRRALNENRKVLCIATQVVEAGVDISFQTVVRFEAGIDSIVQAAGRCNRSGEFEKECKTYIIECTDESLVKLEEIRMARNSTQELIYEYNQNPECFGNDLSSDKSVQLYYDVLYRDLSSRSGYFDYSLQDLPTLYELMTDRHEKETSYFMNQALKTAGENFKPLDNSSFTLLVPYEDGLEIITELCSERCRHDLKYAKTLLEKAKKFSVSIMAYQIKDLYKRDVVYSIYNDSVYVLREEYYDEYTGLIIRKEEVDKCNILIL